MAPFGVDLAMTQTRLAMLVIGMSLVIVGGVGLVLRAYIWVGCGVRWIHCLWTLVYAVCRAVRLAVPALKAHKTMGTTLTKNVQPYERHRPPDQGLFTLAICLVRIPSLPRLPQPAPHLMRGNLAVCCTDSGAECSEIPPFKPGAGSAAERGYDGNSWTEPPHVNTP